jgi:hypothetical protein
MEREIVERLAIDKALGELDADTAALLEAYLAEHAEARTWAQAMTQTCTQTREAISQKTRPDAQWHAADRSSRLAAPAWRTFGRWAAVIVVSLGIGAVAGRWSRPPAPTTERVVVETRTPPAPDGWRQLLHRPESGFWQTKAVAMMEPRRDGVVTDHDAHKRLWDKYRPSAKEWSYE